MPGAEQTDVSLVIPTRNRFHLLDRALDFYAGAGLRCPILIADSSQGAKRDELAALARRHEGRLALSVLSAEPDIGFWRKLYEAVASVRTPFVAIAGDDDYIFPAAMRLCLDFLRGNPDHACAGGLELRVALPGPMLATSSRFSAIASPQPDLAEDSAERRLLHHFAHYWPTIYSLHRRPAITAALEVAGRCPGELIVSELVSSGISVVHGKYKAFERPFIVRQVYHESSTAFVTWADIAAAPDFARDVAFFEAELGRALNVGQHGALVARRALGAYLAGQGIVRAELNPAEVALPPEWAEPLPPVRILPPLRALAAFPSSDRDQAVSVFESVLGKPPGRERPEPPRPGRLGARERALLAAAALSGCADVAVELARLRARCDLVTFAIAEQVLDQNHYRSPELPLAIHAANLCGSAGLGGGFGAWLLWLAESGAGAADLPEAQMADAETPEPSPRLFAALADGDFAGAAALAGSAAALARHPEGTILVAGIAAAARAAADPAAVLAFLDDPALAAMTSASRALKHQKAHALRLCGAVERAQEIERSLADRIGDLPGLLAALEGASFRRPIIDRLRGIWAGRSAPSAGGLDAVERALDRAASATGLDLPFLRFRLDVEIGARLRQADAQASARERLERAVATLERLGGGRDWRLCRPLGELSLIAAAAGLREQAAELGERALALHIAAFGDGDAMADYYRSLAQPA